MAGRGYYKPGDRLAICDRCGFVYYLSELRKTWDGLLCCPKDWEPEHPSNFARVRPERPRNVEGRPDSEPTFVAVNEVTAEDL